MPLPLLARPLWLGDGPLPPPPAGSLVEAEAEMAEDFALIPDWMDRYGVIIDMGKQLPALPEACRDEAHRIRGCQSRVWLALSVADGRVFFTAAAEAATVAGLVALLRRIYDGRPAHEVAAASPAIFERLGFAEHLTPSRANGFRALYDAVQGAARDAG